MFGNVKLSFSAGSINLKKRQKKLQPLALVSLFKTLMLKTKFLKGKGIGLHLKNTKTYYELLILKLIKQNFFLNFVRSYNNSPHNGCRPKKLKRFKRRTKRLVLMT